MCRPVEALLSAEAATAVRRLALVWSYCSHVQLSACFVFILRIEIAFFLCWMQQRVTSIEGCIGWEADWEAGKSKAPVNEQQVSGPTAWVRWLLACSTGVGSTGAG